MSPKAYISHLFPTDADAAGPGNTFPEPPGDAVKD